MQLGFVLGFANSKAHVLGEILLLIVNDTTS